MPTSLTQTGAARFEVASHSFKSLWHYVEVHHAEYGCALFVMPAVVVAFALFGAVQAISWLVG